MHPQTRELNSHGLDRDNPHLSITVMHILFNHLSM